MAQMKTVELLIW